MMAMKIIIIIFMICLKEIDLYTIYKYNLFIKPFWLVTNLMAMMIDSFKDCYLVLVILSYKYLHHKLII